MHKTILALVLALLATSLSAAEIPWQSDLQAAHATAQAHNKLLLIHFYSDHCVYCDRLEQGAFQSPEVLEAIQTHFVPVKIHGIKNAELSQYFKIKGFPMDVVVDPAGNIFSHSISPQQPTQYVDMLLTAMNRHRMQQQPGEQIAAAPHGGSYMPGQPPQAGANAALAAPAMPPAGMGSAAPAPAAGGSFAPSQFASHPNGGAYAPPATSGSPEAPLAAPENADFALPSTLVDEAVADYHTEQASGYEPGGSPSAAAGGFAMPPTDNSLAAGPAPQMEDAAAGGMGSRQPGAAGSSLDPALDPSSQLALDGHCPVSVMSGHQWVAGDERYGAYHMGRLYLFADAAAQQAFMASPDDYAPMLAGNDIVALIKHGQVTRGTREWGLVHHGRMYLFSGEESFNEFYASPEKFSVRAEEIMRQASAASGSTMR